MHKLLRESQRAYINDLPEVIEHSTCFGYADDYKLIANNSAELENDLASLFNWWKVNGMNLHESKCNILNFKKASCVQMNNKNVNVARYQKDLGIIVSDTNLESKCKQASLQSTTSTVVTYKKSVIVQSHEIQAQRLHRTHCSHNHVWLSGMVSK